VTEGARAAKGHDAMLIIERKIGAMVRIGRHVTVRVRSIRGNQRVRLEIDAPREIPVVREELDVWDDEARGVRRLRVLLVEDDPGHAELLELALSERQADTIYRVGDAEEAIATLDGLAESDEPAPDLVLLDLRLPGRSGEELLRELRGRSDTRLVPIVVMTAQADESRVTTCMEAGATLVIEKRPSYQGLADSVSRVLALFEQAAAPGQHPSATPERPAR